MKNVKPDVEIYDTTLREDSQGEGINFSATDKLRIAEKLDASALTSLKAEVHEGCLCLDVEPATSAFVDVVRADDQGYDRFAVQIEG